MINFIEKYTPNTFDDFIMNNETKNLLNVFIEINKLNILIIGDSGTGKTTLLNTLLNTYYKNVSLNNKKNDLILHINLLKDQGIHIFRQNIKTFCQTTIHKIKKTIVIDNIDQISEQTQQIIRNNIDKYSHKVNFIMSCTNIQKVVDNLQSRVNIIKLHKLSNDDLSIYCKNIVKKENILIHNTCIDYLVHISNNSIRLLLSYLTKLTLLDCDITIDIIKDVCMQISDSLFDEYTDLLLNKNDLNGGVEKINTIINGGFSVMDILETYFHYIKNISKMDDSIKFKIFPIICKYINIFHSIHENAFEIILFTYELYNTLQNK